MLIRVRSGSCQEQFFCSPLSLVMNWGRKRGNCFEMERRDGGAILLGSLGFTLRPSDWRKSILPNKVRVVSLGSWRLPWKIALI
jgi:hypothetical protein